MVTMWSKPDRSSTTHEEHGLLVLGHLAELGVREAGVDLDEVAARVL